MPAIVRFQDKCSGHSCFPPRPNNQASDNVLVNGKGAHRQNDSWELHACPNTPPHGGVLSTGSESVYINGKPVARIGDPISCGSRCAEGSGNVFAGG
jgi:uncharacterized Zn-binding protein involved in type VI secretion